jgi:hypothetical protein
MYNYTTELIQLPGGPGPVDPGPVDPNAPPPLTTDLPAPWHYAHCWVDNAFGRILSIQGLPPSPTMTVQICISFCDSQGFALAGLQFSQGSWSTPGLLTLCPEHLSRVLVW